MILIILRMDYNNVCSQFWRVQLLALELRSVLTLAPQTLYLENKYKVWLMFSWNVNDQNKAHDYMLGKSMCHSFFSFDSQSSISFNSTIQANVTKRCRACVFGCIMVRVCFCFSLLFFRVQQSQVGTIKHNGC